MTAWTAIAAAAALGAMSSIAPCPLAANVAAMSYVARRVGRPKLALLGAAWFIFGQVLAYVMLAALLTWPLLRINATAAFLQRYLPKLLGPLMIVVGVLLLELIPTGFVGGISQRWRKRAESAGLAGELLLGAMLALAFCPTTAALYFGQLIPLSLRFERPLTLPVAFGIGAAAPIMALALVLALATNRLGAAYAAISTFQKWARWIAGAAFAGAGIYLTLVHIYGIIG